MTGSRFYWQNLLQWIMWQSIKKDPNISLKSPVHAHTYLHALSSWTHLRTGIHMHTPQTQAHAKYFLRKTCNPLPMSTWALCRQQFYFILFFGNLTQLENLERGNLIWEYAPLTRLVYGQICGILPWLMILVGGPSPLWMLPSLGRCP